MENQSYLEQVKALKQMLAQLPPSTKEHKDKLWMKFRIDWNYHANHIEGSSLTYAEIESLLDSDIVSDNKQPKEIEAAKSLDKAIRMVADEARAKSKPLTDTFIQLLFSKLTDVGTNADRLAELLAWYNKQKDFDPIVLAATFYYRYLLIQREAQRSAQLLMNYILMKNDFPPVIISSDDMGSYEEAMRQAKGNLNTFVEYIASQMLVSLDLSIKTLSTRKADEADAWKKKLQGLKQILPED